MKCPWCANPEGMRPEGVLMTEPDFLFDSCCPRGAVSEKRLDRALCHACADRPCLAMRQKGIRLSCREAEVDDLVLDCAGSAPMFFDGGGVTLTGGEVTLQFEAVSQLLCKLGERGIHRAIETNGSHPRSGELMPLVDEWIMDFKHYDGAKHRQWLGISNSGILKTLALAAENHPDVLIRIPMMPGFNDSEADADAFAACLVPHAARDNVRLEVLTYHEFGKGKWAQCGWEYPMRGGRVTPESRNRLENALKGAGMRVVRT